MIVALGVDLSAVVPGPVLSVLNNARIESALAHARALSDFLGRKPNRKGKREYLHHSHFIKDWDHDVTNFVGRIFGPISEHLSHPVIGDSIDDPHPGKWPLVELAVVLVEGLKDFIADAMDRTPTFDASWFTPRPYATYFELMYCFPLGYPTWPSEHRDVRRLTLELHAYLQHRGLLDDDLTTSWELQGHDASEYPALKRPIESL